MADRKISDGSALAAASVDAANDLIPIVDVSVAAASQNKNVKPQDLRVPLFSGASVKKSTDETGANYTSATYVAFDAEDYDVGGWHDNSTNNTRLTVPAGVNYIMLTFCAKISSYSGVITQIIINKNNASNVPGSLQINAVNNSSLTVNTVVGPIPVTAGDYFEAQLLLTTDTSVTIESAYTRFTAWAVG